MGDAMRSPTAGRELVRLGRRGGRLPMLEASVSGRLGEAQARWRPAPPAAAGPERPRRARSCSRRPRSWHQPSRVGRVTLSLATAGESHGPALVAILSGLPAGLALDRDAVDADLRRRQEGYGRSPRQRIEQDRVEVLAGLRHGRTLGTPLALVVSNRDHENWQWGMSPWPPEGEATGKGTKAVTVPRPGHADLAGALKFGLADTRDALERASARHTAVAVAAGSVCKALLRTVSIEVEGRVATEDLEGRIDDARADRDTVGGVVEVRAGGVPPGLGSYATKEERLDARLAAALMGSRRSRGSRSATVSRSPSFAARRPTTRSATGCVAPAIVPGGSRPASRTGRRSSSARR